VLIFSNGPLTATGYQASNRFSVSTKSPLTGTVLDANSGGFWGMQFKKAGYDVMIVRGKVEKPVWIEIKNDLITFHDASELWGMRVFALTEKLGQLKPHDLVETRLDKNDSGVALASTELLVHRTIYKMTPALAIVHCHPRMTIAFSLSREAIVPVDNEGSYLLKKVPIVTEEFASGTPEMANKVAAALQNYKTIMLRGMVVSPSARLWTRLSSGPVRLKKPARSPFMLNSSTSLSSSTAK